MIRRDRTLVLKNNEVPASIVAGDQCLSRRCVTIGSVEIFEVPWESGTADGVCLSLNGCTQGFFEHSFYHQIHSAIVRSVAASEEIYPLIRRGYRGHDGKEENSGVDVDFQHLRFAAYF
jgi:hypothetical protein